jgi:hypothetical protein
MSGTVRIIGKIDVTILHAAANWGAGKNVPAGPTSESCWSDRGIADDVVVALGVGGAGRGGSSWD